MLFHLRTGGDIDIEIIQLLSVSTSDELSEMRDLIGKAVKLLLAACADAAITPDVLEIFGHSWLWSQYGDKFLCHLNILTFLWMV